MNSHIYNLWTYWRGNCYLKEKQALDSRRYFLDLTFDLNIQPGTSFESLFSDLRNIFQCVSIEQSAGKTPPPLLVLLQQRAVLHHKDGYQQLHEDR